MVTTALGVEATMRSSVRDGFVRGQWSRTAF